MCVSISQKKTSSTGFFNNIVTILKTQLEQGSHKALSCTYQNVTLSPTLIINLLPLLICLSVVNSIQEHIGPPVMWSPTVVRAVLWSVVGGSAASSPLWSAGEVYKMSALRI